MTNSPLEVAFDPPTALEKESLELAQRVKVALKGAWSPTNGYFDYGFLVTADGDYVVLGDSHGSAAVRMYPRENIARIDYELEQ